MIAFVNSPMSQNVDSTTFKVNPKFMQTGSGQVNVQSPGSGGGATEVTYPIPFDNAPKVFVTLKSGSGTGASITAYAGDEKKFYALARFVISTGTIPTPFNWMAIDDSQPPFIPDNQ